MAGLAKKNEKDRRSFFKDHGKRTSLMVTTLADVKDMKWVAAGEYAGNIHPSSACVCPPLPPPLVCCC